jgi:hypothetical protein
MRSFKEKGKTMNILRTAFWLSIVILLLPTGREDSVENPADKVSLNQAVSAASETASDLVGFCDRNPGVCETGQNAVKAFADKAKYGANLLYQWAAGADATPPKASVPAAADGLGKQADAQPVISRKMDKINKANRLKPSPRDAASGNRRSQNTLNPNDLAPAWKGPRSNA